jgi:hypothetical protein
MCLIHINQPFLRWIFSEASKAHELVENRLSTGKVLLDVKE